MLKINSYNISLALCFSEECFIPLYNSLAQIKQGNGYTALHALYNVPTNYFVKCTPTCQRLFDIVDRGKKHTLQLRRYCGQVLALASLTSGFQGNLRKRHCEDGVIAISSCKEDDESAVSGGRGLKFNEICEEKKGWHLKVRHFLVVEGIFQFQVFLGRKLIFENIQGVYKVFRGCSVKEKRKGNQRLEATSRKFKRANDSKSISAPIRQKSPLFSNPFPKTFLSSVCELCIYYLCFRSYFGPSAGPSNLSYHQSKRYVPFRLSSLILREGQSKRRIIQRS